jgi:hypothetical protein
MTPATDGLAEPVAGTSSGRLPGDADRGGKPVARRPEIAAGSLGSLPHQWRHAPGNEPAAAKQAGLRKVLGSVARRGWRGAASDGLRR